LAAKRAEETRSLIYSPVDSIGVVVIEVGDTFLQFGAALALLNGHDEELNVGIQGELVHGVDATHVVQNKEQDGGALCTWPVPLMRNKSRYRHESDRAQFHNDIILFYNILQRFQADDFMFM